MQKKLIALAIAGLSGAAFAQSNVTIYGAMDLGQAWVKSSDVGAIKGQQSVGRLDNNSSHIGFKGAESLGNGLTAVFQYESNFTADTAGALSGGRDTYIGLAGGFGTVAAGNLTHPLRAFGSKVELMPGAAGFGTTSSVTGYINGVLGGIKTTADERASNAIAYISPAMNGFTFIAAYVNGEAKPNDTAATAAVARTQVGATGVYLCPNGTAFDAAGTCTAAAAAATGGNDRAWQIAGQYANGPLFAGLAYHKRSDLFGTDGLDARVYRLVGTYDFPSATKVTFLYDNSKFETTAGLAGKRAAYSLGVAQSFGASTIGLEHARSNKVKADAGDIADSESKITSLVYSYGLSKRTTVHARYSKLDNKAAANNAFYNNAVANPTALSAGSDSTGYMVGLRHTF